MPLHPPDARSKDIWWTIERILESFRSLLGVGGESYFSCTFICPDNARATGKITYFGAK